MNTTSAINSPKNLDALRAGLAKLTTEELLLLQWQSRWRRIARPKQVDLFDGRNTTLVQTGRGWGKTRTGVNWLCGELCTTAGTFGHAIAPTYNDVRYTLFEGPVGVLREVPERLITHYSKTDLVITFSNGSILRGFTAEEPERLRGPQCHYLLCDEMAAWTNLRETWEQARFGHRLGKNTLALITTTPKPRDLIMELAKDQKVRKIYGSLHENEANLAPAFIEEMEKLRGTRLGRQEVEGELIDPEESGVVQRSWWKMWPAETPLPRFDIIIMSLDTAMSEDEVNVKKNKTDFTACSVWGGFREKVGKAGTDIPQTREPRIMLLDCWQERLGFPDLVARVKKEKGAAYGDSAFDPIVRPLIGPGKILGLGRKPDLVLIEDVNSGRSLRQTLRREGVPVIPYTPVDDKYMRLNLVAPMFASGFIYAVESRSRRGEFMTWADPLIRQMCTYSGKNSLEHEDLMDSGTQALIYFERNWLPRVKARKGEDEKQEYPDRPAPRNPYAS